MTLVRSRHFLVVGQSYGREGYQHGGSYGPFMSAIRDAISADPATIQSRIGGSPTIADGQLFQLLNRAVDGSAVLQQNDGGSGYWVENDLITDGPLLASAISAIGADTTGHSCIVYSHGEQDSANLSTASEATNVATAMLHLLTELRTAENPGNPGGVPVFVDMLGPRFPSNELGEYLLRDAMIDMIDANARIYRGAEKYAAFLDSTTHPAEGFEGYARLGAWAGRKAAHWLLNDAALDGPSIGTVTRTGSSVTVPINVPVGETLIKPSVPDFFGLFDASENRIPITNYSWSGDTLTLTAAETPAKFRYPARKGGNSDIRKIVRLSDPSSPYYPGEPGLPLESVKTVTF